MCVIIQLPKGVSLPYSALEVGYDNNPDGWGIMAVIDGKMETVKAYKDFNAFKAAWRNFPQNVDRAIHFRWATHGKTNDENCHPFPVTPELMMMHNGILRTVEVDKDMSDSWNFATHDLGKPEIINSYGPDVLTREDFKKMVEDCTSGSRLLFMDKEGRMMRTATWEKRFGAYFSNSANFAKKWKAGNSTAKTQPRHYDGWGEHAADDYSGYYSGRYGTGHNRGKDFYRPIKDTDAEAGEQAAFSDLVPYGRTIDGADAQDYVPRSNYDSERQMTLEQLEAMEPNDLCDWVMDNPWAATDLICELTGKETAFPIIARKAG